MQSNEPVHVATEQGLRQMPTNGNCNTTKTINITINAPYTITFHPIRITLFLHAQTYYFFIILPLDQMCIIVQITTVSLPIYTYC